MAEPTSSSTGDPATSSSEGGGTPTSEAAPLSAATSIAGGFVSSGSAPVAAPASGVTAGGSASSAPVTAASAPAPSAPVPSARAPSAPAASAPAPSAPSSTASSSAGAPSESTLDARFDKSRNLLAETKEALADESRRRELDDRSRIAKLIVNAFVYLIVAVIVFIAVGVADKGWASWTEASEFFLKVLSSVLLPVVTLVIGYYFGKDK